ncbi:MAG TPA: lanthionine synthetase LanC family protein [Frankiaceae bacterium]|nr:lanthionine synthetase LanC family protein [Frankiaceae bacterium]
MDGLEAAAAVARWLRGRAAGGAWPSDGVAEGGADDTTLAWGPAGVALFLLRAYETLADETLLAAARPGLATVAGQRSAGPAAGLYGGAAGRAYVLAEAYRVTGDPAWHAAAVTAAEALPLRGEAAELFDGLAGTGLVLLDVAATLDRPSFAERARELAAHLAAVAEPAGPGLRWIPPGRDELPNFAHGTAGVAYFLAVAGEPGAAAAAGDYLASLARIGGGRCEVPFSPGRPGTFWGNWCHGPAGTVRLWSALADVTGEPRWSAYRDGARNALLATLLPGGLIRDLGDDATLCCGSAGIHEALLDAVVGTGEAAYVTGARRALAHLERCASADATGLCWPQARRRRTGWLGGAAGTGYALLRRGAYDHGLPLPRPLPDAPARREAVIR